MENDEVLAAILRDNESAKKLSELIPIIIRVIAAYQADQIDLPKTGVRSHGEYVMWSPSVIPNRQRPTTHSRAFTMMQVATLLQRLQTSVGRRKKADRSVTSAFALLRQFEQGNLDPATFELLATGLSLRGQLELARKLSKVQ